MQDIAFWALICLITVHPESYFSKAAIFDLLPACVAAEILIKGKTGWKFCSRCVGRFGAMGIEAWWIWVGETDELKAV